jgi:hypothetical protein
MSLDLKRDPSSEASSRASLSLFSCNFRRIDELFLVSRAESDQMGWRGGGSCGVGLGSEEGWGKEGEREKEIIF